MRSVDDGASDLGLASEGEWQLLRRQFELAGDPWLGWVFCPAPGPVTVLRQRTEFMLQDRAKKLLRIAPASPEVLRVLMPQLFESLPQADCVWVEVIAVDGPLSTDEVGPWAGAWDWLMLRLNERRDALRRRLKGALIFAVHPDWKPRARNAAPDFWSVRGLVLELPGSKSESQIDRPSASDFIIQADDDAEYIPSVDAALAAVDRLAAASSPDPQSLARLHMRAASALLAAGRASEAAEQADRALARLHNRRVRLRAQALMVAARVKRADNGAAAALHHLSEAVDLWRWMLAEHGVMPQTLRDLSVALLEKGDLHINAGERKAAKAACEESLAIGRRLLETGETAQSLHHLAASLDRMGNLCHSAGDLPAAKAAYLESLALCRRLLETTGETPQSLRDLSVSLERVGDIEANAGDMAAAKAAYEETQHLRERLEALLG